MEREGVTRGTLGTDPDRDSELAPESTADLIDGVEAPSKVNAEPGVAPDTGRMYAFPVFSSPSGRCR